MLNGRFRESPSRALNSRSNPEGPDWKPRITHDFRKRTPYRTFCSSQDSEEPYDELSARLRALRKLSSSQLPYLMYPRTQSARFPFGIELSVKSATMNWLTLLRRNRILLKFHQLASNPPLDSEEPFSEIQRANVLQGTSAIAHFASELRRTHPRSYTDLRDS